MAVSGPGGETRPASPAALSGEALLLREQVLHELAAVKGAVSLAEKLTGPDAKAQLRRAHEAQRAALLAQAEPWLRKREDELIRHFADGREVDPASADPVIVPVRTPLDADLFRYAALQWSVPVSSGYGRRSRFLVRDRSNDKLMAIFALGDPVIAQASRDAAIGWDKANRNQKLYNVYDAFVLGAVEPYRQLLAGKLAALMTISNEVRDFLSAKYSGNSQGIHGDERVKDPTPVLVTTSSALGRSSVYNRVTYNGRTMFHSVGYTKGFGHFQFSGDTFDRMLGFVRGEVLDDPSAKVGSSKYGSGPNWRFRVIRTALNALAIPDSVMNHNVRREVFLAPAAAGWDAYLRGESAGYEPFDMPAAAIGDYWRERWAIGRAERRPEFREWRAGDGRLLGVAARAARAGRPAGAVRSTPGALRCGPFTAEIGTARRAHRGRTADGQASEGEAYTSRVRGLGLDVTVADITWSSGEREIVGTDRHGSPASYEDIVGRLRIGVHDSGRYRNMLMMELRAARRGTGRSRAGASMLAEAALNDMAQCDVAAELDSLTEASVGTREALLGDGGPRRRQLCAVFSAEDRVTPVLAWLYTRLAPLAADDGLLTDAGALLPELLRPAPSPKEMALEDPDA